MDLELLPVAETNGRYTITARLDGESLTDRLTITKASARATFAKQVCERWPQVPKQDLDAELERLAGEHTAARARRPDGGGDGELDPSTRISRIEGKFFSCAIEFTRTECSYSRISAPIAGRTQWVKRCGSSLSVV